MKSKTICIFLDTFHPGGAERVCINYANELTQLGYKVTICVFNLEKKFYLNELNKNVFIKNLNVRNGVGFFKKLLSENSLLNASDVLITFNHQITLVLFILKKIKSIVTPLIARNVNNLQLDLKAKKGSFIKRLLTNFLMTLFYKHIDHYIAQCNSMKEDMIKHYNIDSQKISVIYNPISQAFKKIDLNKEIDLLFVGRLKAQKGIDNLLKIMTLVVKEKPNVYLYIVGEGELESILLNGLDELNVNYTHERKSQNLLHLYNTAHLTILTSWYEGYPNVLVESIACGTPVISFNCKSGPKEIIDNEKNGFLIEDFNTEIFSQKVIDNINNPLVIEARNSNNKEILKLDNVIRKIC